MSGRSIRQECKRPGGTVDAVQGNGAATGGSLIGDVQELPVRIDGYLLRLIAIAAGRGNRGRVGQGSRAGDGELGDLVADIVRYVQKLAVGVDCDTQTADRAGRKPL